MPLFQKRFLFALTLWVFASIVGTVPVSAASDPACGEVYLCDQALIKFSRHLRPDAVSAQLREWHLKAVRYFPRSRLYQVELPRGSDTLAFVAALQGQDFVLLAEPNWVVHGSLLPDDSDFDLLWGLNNAGQTGGTIGTDIGMDEVWDQFTDGSGVVVAVIDSGVDYNHPDLAANMWVNAGEIPGNGIDDDLNGFVDDVHGYDFRNDDSDPMDDHEHGTHVSGILGAVGNNSAGIAGVAWSVKIMALKFLNASASGNVADAIACIEYAMANGAKIFNNSWGGGAYDPSLLAAIFDSDEAGVIFVAAAGNQGRNTDTSPFFPADYDSPNIISVGAHTHSNQLWTFSNYGINSVDLAAPGAAIYSTKPGNTYGYISGTSMATAYVSGAAALLWTQFPSLSHRQIINLLFQGTTPETYLSDKTLMGGRLNVANSVAIAQNPSNQAPQANAGSDQMEELGQVIQLHGSATDPDGDFPLIFEWTLTPPPGSLSKLSQPVSKDPSFVPDREGTYTLNLVVSDSLISSLPDMMTVTIAGGALPPPTVVLDALARDLVTGEILDLTTGIPVAVGQEVFLDGEDSTSLFPENLLFHWTWISRPADSAANLEDPDTAKSAFIPDQAGTYTLRLTVEDGYGENHADFSVLVQKDEETPADLKPDAPSGSPQGPQAAGCSLHKEF